MLGVGADRVGIAPATFAFFAARFSYGYADRHIAVEIAAVAVGNFNRGNDKNFGKHAFVFFKEIIPPRNKDKNMVEEIDIDSICLDELTSVLCYMHEINPKNIYGNLALRAYIECLESIKSILS